MKACHYCGRNFKDDGYVRCPGCRERAKVYQHQLHKRRGQYKPFKRHICGLCRKHRKLCVALNSRWDERGIYVFVTCPRGHRRFRWSRSNDYCSTCYMRYTVPELVKRGLIPRSLLARKSQVNR